MSDYILEIKVGELKPNPINETIYNDNPDALEELKNSIEQNGLLEPITAASAINGENFNLFSKYCGEYLSFSEVNDKSVILSITTK